MLADCDSQKRQTAALQAAQPFILMRTSETSRLKPVVLICLSLCAVSTSCGDRGVHVASADRCETASVEFFAAASTSNAVDEIVAVFHRATATDVKTNYASSSTLAQQITQGAAAGIYLSANQKWADYLDTKQMASSRVDLLANRLVVIVPRDSTLRLATPDDLLGKEIEYLALGDPTHVPAGEYAKKTLENLGLWNRLEAKVVAGADVRQALSYVERGEADAGIVYATDALIADRVRVAFRIDPSSTPPIRYPLVLTHRGSGDGAAESLFEFVQGAEAAPIWRKYGFTVLGPYDEAAEADISGQPTSPPLE